LFFYLQLRAVEIHPIHYAGMRPAAIQFAVTMDTEKSPASPFAMLSRKLANPVATRH
jgi:hypothetical protein